MRRIAAAALAVSVLSACANDDGRTLRAPRPDQAESVAPASTAPPTFAVTGTWSEGGAIDVRHTCDGLNIAPTISWSAPPAGVGAFAVVLLDNDAPDYYHWVVANIDAAAVTLDEGTIPDGVVVAENSAGRAGYAGPCPPTGASHTYSLSLYALSAKVEAGSDVSATDLLAQIQAAQIAVATSTFTFAR